MKVRTEVRKPRNCHRLPHLRKECHHRLRPMRINEQPNEVEVSPSDPFRVSGLASEANCSLEMAGRGVDVAFRLVYEPEDCGCSRTNGKARCWSRIEHHEIPRHSEAPDHYERVRENDPRR